MYHAEFTHVAVWLHYGFEYRGWNGWMSDIVNTGARELQISIIPRFNSKYSYFKENFKDHRQVNIKQVLTSCRFMQSLEMANKIFQQQVLNIQDDGFCQMKGAWEFFKNLFPEPIPIRWVAMDACLLNAAQVEKLHLPRTQHGYFPMKIGKVNINMEQMPGNPEIVVARFNIPMRLIFLFSSFHDFLYMDEETKIHKIKNSV